MLNEIENHKNAYSWIAWGLTIIVIVLTLHIMSAEAEKPKTLDVIPIGGSDEFYERDYPKAPRLRPSIKRPRPSEDTSLPQRPRPGGYNMDYSGEYNARQRQRENELKARKAW